MIHSLDREESLSSITSISQLLPRIEPGLISLYLTSINRLFTSTYKRRCRTENLWVCGSGPPLPIGASQGPTMSCGCQPSFAIWAKGGVRDRCATKRDSNSSCAYAGAHPSSSRPRSCKAQTLSLNREELRCMLCRRQHGRRTLLVPVLGFDHGHNTGPHDGSERFWQAGPSVQNVGQVRRNSLVDCAALR